jgi:aconitate hydratase
MLRSKDSFKTRSTLEVNDTTYTYYALKEGELGQIPGVDRLPVSIKVLLENLLRHEDGVACSREDILALANSGGRAGDDEFAYHPARVLMQDFTGVPGVVDLAAMRNALVKRGADPQKINPLSPVDLVIDHSVTIDRFGNAEAFKENVEIEMQRNLERYQFLKWGQGAFNNFSVVPPGTGICHQVNLEYLSQTIWTDVDQNGNEVAYPDTLVGTDSHTTMVNGLGVLGWGVGGIEAEAAMLGQPVSMLIPEVVGFKLTGEMREGITATDLVLRIVEMLREKGVVGKFVEFYGSALGHLSLPNRSTIANMAPEYGATCGIFPVDAETITYLKLTARDDDRIALVEAYAKAQGMWHDASTPDPVFTSTLELDVSTVEPAISGPKRPQDRINLKSGATAFASTLKDMANADAPREADVDGADYKLRDGDVVIAAITSCTNTSNPDVLIAAGLVAQKARALGLQSKPWVKTSLAPGSQVVGDYLQDAGLQDHLDAMGFNIAGFGCTTCIGNSGPLAEPIAKAIQQGDLVATAVLSGNRNFEGRISPHVKANYLASPPLVVAYAIAGSMTRDIVNEPLAKDKDGNPVYLKDIWPTNAEIAETVNKVVTANLFAKRYADVFKGTPAWQNVKSATGETYTWNAASTYIQNPPFFTDLAPEPDAITDIKGAKLLAVLGDSITTDHISPAGGFGQETPAGQYLTKHQVRPQDFNSYGSRRGNHEIMMRGTFANIRVKNELAPDTEGGFSVYNGEQTTMYDAAMKHMDDGTPLVVVGGTLYGNGSSRDWAAKGTKLLGVKAVLVESYERIHRSNLVGMGVLPLEFKNGQSRADLNLDGSETFDITGIEGGITPSQDVDIKITRTDGSVLDITAKCRIDTLDEVEYYRNGGILSYVLRNLNKS